MCTSFIALSKKRSNTKFYERNLFFLYMMYEGNFFSSNMCNYIIEIKNTEKYLQPIFIPSLRIPMKYFKMM